MHWFRYKAKLIHNYDHLTFLRGSCSGFLAFSRNLDVYI